MGSSGFRVGPTRARGFLSLNPGMNAGAWWSGVASSPPAGGLHLPGLVVNARLVMHALGADVVRNSFCRLGAPGLRPVTYLPAPQEVAPKSVARGSLEALHDDGDAHVRRKLNEHVHVVEGGTEGVHRRSKLPCLARRARSSGASSVASIASWRPRVAQTMCTSKRLTE